MPTDLRLPRIAVRHGGIDDVIHNVRRNLGRATLHIDADESAETTEQNFNT